MTEPIFRFPATCPRCGKKSLNELAVADVAIALMKRHSLRLRADCHQISWTTSKSEEQQIREYLAANRSEF
jgi:hypothetical protein